MEFLFAVGPVLGVSVTGLLLRLVTDTPVKLQAVEILGYLGTRLTFKAGIRIEL